MKLCILRVPGGFCCRVRSHYLYPLNKNKYNIAHTTMKNSFMHCAHFLFLHFIVFQNRIQLLLVYSLPKRMSVARESSRTSIRS